jgi:hypothetical protein
MWLFRCETRVAALRARVLTREVQPVVCELGRGAVLCGCAALRAGRSPFPSWEQRDLLECCVVSVGWSGPYVLVGDT